MAKFNDAQEQLERRLAVATMLHYISEGLMEGVWTNFKFDVRQHRSEKRDLNGRPLRVSPGKLEIKFSMDVDEQTFKADIAKRKAEVDEALRIVEDDHVDRLLIEHEDNGDGSN